MLFIKPIAHNFRSKYGVRDALYESHSVSIICMGRLLLRSVIMKLSKFQASIILSNLLTQLAKCFGNAPTKHVMNTARIAGMGSTY